MVNDWYITAYEPIKDVSDKIIGILYVGSWNNPTWTPPTGSWPFVLMAGLMVLFLFDHAILLHRPHHQPVATDGCGHPGNSQGDLSHKVEVTSKDEIGYLADSFNQMTANLRAANEKLLEWGRTLEKKVEERTQELTKMQAHLIQSEKLASMGKLAAGIAHEINNPLGGILIYSHLLLEDTPKDNPNHENLKKIVKETSRCKDIVKGLLDFARPKEPEMSQIVINEMLERSLSIMEGQALFQNIRIRKELLHRPSHDRGRRRSAPAGIHEHHPQRRRGHGGEWHPTIRTGSEKRRTIPSISISRTRVKGYRKRISNAFSSHFSRLKRWARERGWAWPSATASFANMKGPSKSTALWTGSHLYT